MFISPICFTSNSRVNLKKKENASNNFHSVDDYYSDVFQKMNKTNPTDQKNQTIQKMISIKKEIEKMNLKLIETVKELKEYQRLNPGQKDETFKKLELKIAVIKSEIKKLEDESQKNTKYYDLLCANPKIAFMLNPNLTKKEKEQLAKNCASLDSTETFCQKHKINETMAALWAKEGKLISYKAESIYFPKNNSINESFIKKIREKIKYTKTIDELFQEGYDKEALVQSIKKGQIELFELNKIPTSNLNKVYVDMKSKKTKAALEKIEKLPISTVYQNRLCDEFKKYGIEKMPARSKYFIETSKEKESLNQPIGISRLVSLGFGSYESIMKAVEEGYLETTVQLNPMTNAAKSYYIDTKQGEKTQEALKILREENLDVYNIAQFIKKCRITREELFKAIKENEVDFIDEYILQDDDLNLYFNIENEKNKNFIEKCKLNRIQKQQEKYNKDFQKENYLKLDSLKRDLIWYYISRGESIKDKAPGIKKYVKSLIEQNKINSNNEYEKEYEIKQLTQFQIDPQTLSQDYAQAIYKAQMLIEIIKEEGFENFESDLINVLEPYKDLFIQK